VTARLLDGEAVAARVRAEVAERAGALEARGITPGLGTLLVGDDGPSARYVAMKQADCAAVGIASHHVHLPAEASQGDVEEVVRRFNDDPAVDAYIMQYPFPAHLDYESALLAVDPDKDADGLHPVNLGRLVQGVPRVLPCTPAGILRLLADHGIQSALVEGGRELHTSLLRAGLADRIVVFVSPQIIGGKTLTTPTFDLGISRMRSALTLKNVETRFFGTDACIEGYLNTPPKSPKPPNL